MLISNSPEPGTSKMNELLSNPVLWAKTKAAMAVHPKMSTAVRGRSVCLTCGWVAEANDEGWNLDNIPGCVP